MNRLIKLDKDFLNKEAYATVRKKAPRETLQMLEVRADRADATGGEPIFSLTGDPLGHVSSGTYGYTVGKSLALGFLKDAVAGDEVDVMVLGRPHRARVLAEPPFDPQGARLRA